MRDKARFTCCGGLTGFLLLLLRKSSEKQEAIPPSCTGYGMCTAANHGPQRLLLVLAGNIDASTDRQQWSHPGMGDKDRSGTTGGFRRGILYFFVYVL